MNTTTTTVRSLLSKLGYTCPPSSWYSRIDGWRTWYKGKTNWHRYVVYNGQEKTRCIRKSLRMAKKMSEDKADLLLNEKTRLVVKSNQKALDSVLEANDFWTLGNQLIEKAHALGTGALIEFEEKDSLGAVTVGIDYIDDAGRIWPLSWQKGKITECAFASIEHDARLGKLFSLELHVLVNGKYQVQNYRFDKDGKAVDLAPGVQPMWTRASDIPTFQIIKPNIANNLEESNPMGVSIYANSTDIMKVLDAVYDSYFNEFILGRKRIFADASVLNINMDPNSTEQGTLRPVFDPNDTVFYNYPGLESEKGKPIVESNMTLRVQEHKAALQDNLDLLSENTGFGKGYYKFTVDNVQTATGVIAQNSKLYRKVRKDEILLAAALRDMVRAIFLILDYDQPSDISVSFDDSIIEDTNAKVNRALLEFHAEAIDLVQYYMDTRGVTEKAAIKMVAEKQKREATLGTGLPGAEAEAGAEPDAGGDGADTEAALDGNAESMAEQILEKPLTSTQISSLSATIRQFSSGTLSEGQAVNAISTSLGIPKDQALKLIQGVM